MSKTICTNLKAELTASGQETISYNINTKMVPVVVFKNEASLFPNSLTARTEKM